MNVKDVVAVGKAAAKVTGKVAYENRDIIADGAKMSMSAKQKKNQDNDAKTRFRDFLQWKESGEDIEEFAFKRSELTGRPWEEIVNNINFHNSRTGGKTVVANPKLASVEEPKKQKELPAPEPKKQKALPMSTAAQKHVADSGNIRKYLKYADVQEILGMKVTGAEDIPEAELLELAELMGTVSEGDDMWTSPYGRQVRKELVDISKDSKRTVRDFSPAMVPLFNQAVSTKLIPNYMQEQDVIEKLCALDTRGEYSVIKNKAHRALMIAYNSLN